jgi:single-strand DNA-binding protein
MSDNIVVTGNLTSDPTLNFTTKGDAVANFTIASNHRVKNGDQWEDGEPTFYRASVWRGYAENVAESLTKGTQVIVQGRVYTEAYEDKKTGEQRTSLKLDVDEIGPTLRFATARVARAQRNGNGGGGQQRQSTPPPSNDPWNAAGQQSQGSWDTPGGDSGVPF